MTPHRLKVRAAMRRYGQSQSPNQIQNALVQTGTSSADRLTPAAEIGKFQQFDAEAGCYVFASNTQSVSVPSSQMLSNGRLGKGQKALLAQGTADYTPA
ncbi:hypothetical protein [Microcoleus sp. MON2_D5]|uniref:hypothetical protein n=1 Tax=Microcoleus sp. MON2_D5 TaxID=2818833 RepID=UPI002FD552E0